MYQKLISESYSTKNILKIIIWRSYSYSPPFTTNLIQSHAYKHLHSQARSYTEALFEVGPQLSCYFRLIWPLISRALLLRRFVDEYHFKYTYYKKDFWKDTFQVGKDLHGRKGEDVRINNWKAILEKCESHVDVRDFWRVKIF